MSDVPSSWSSHIAPRVARLADARVGVLGDVMVDRFIWGKVARISPEAPVPIVEVDRSREQEGYRLGGAGNVAHNLTALGARASLFGLLGEDDAARHCWRLLAQARIDGAGIVSLPARPTTLKTRVVAQNQQVVRFDVEDRSPLPASTLDALYRLVTQGTEGLQAVILSDYNKGVLEPEQVRTLITGLKARGIPVCVDPKVRTLDPFKGATLIKPNRQEACAIAGIPSDTPHAVDRAAEHLLRTLECDAVVVTLGEEGMLLRHRDGSRLQIASRARAVFDVTGAGDTSIAVMALGMAAGLDWSDSLELANAAAGVVVGKVGTAVVSPVELTRALELAGAG